MMFSVELETEIQTLTRLLMLLCSEPRRSQAIAGREDLIGSYSSNMEVKIDREAANSDRCDPLLLVTTNTFDAKVSSTVRSPYLSSDEGSRTAVVTIAVAEPVSMMWRDVPRSMRI